MGNQSDFCSSCNEENEAVLNKKTEKRLTQRISDQTTNNTNIINNTNSIGHSYIIPLSGTRHSSISWNLSSINRQSSKFEISNQTQYIGDIIDGKKQGKGKLIFIDGSYYEGNFKDDLFNGKGIFVKNDSIYKGDFLNGKKHGKGKIEIIKKLNNSNNNTFNKTNSNININFNINNNNPIFNNNNLNNNNINNNDNIIEKKIYEGDWNNDEITGEGIEKIQNENGITIYNGNFIKGKKNGKGKLTLPNGFEYYGDFNDDLLEGNGIFKWNEDKYYNGQWKKNCIEGYGILNENSKKYFGYFKNDKKNGIGGYYYKDNNAIVIGNWFNDKLDNGIVIVFDNEKNENIVKMENGIIVKKYSEDEIKENNIRESNIYKQYINLYEEKIKNELK